MPIPLVLTAARLATTAIRIFPFMARIGGAVFKFTRLGRLGGFLGGIARKVGGWGAKLFPWVTVSFLPTLAEKVVQTSEMFWHFDWKISDKQLREDMRSAVTNLYEPLGESLGRSLAAIVVGRGLGGGANIPRVKINPSQIANLIELSGGSEQVRDILIDAITEMWFAVKSAAQTILFKYIYLNGRKYLERKTGKELGGAEEADSFVFAEKFEEKVKQIVPDEEVSGAIIKGFEAFFETLGELLTEEDTYAVFI
jgi:hypothetical protein